MAEFKESGNKLFKEQKWSEAIEEYSKGLGQEGVAPDVKGLLLSNRSQCKIQLKDWEGALEDANACLKLLPEHTKSLFRRATANEKLSRLSDALTDYVQVCKAEPNNTAAVEAASRLREQVLKQQQKKSDEILPSNLLETLKSGGGTPEEVEKQVDAATKLRALVLSRGMAGSVVSTGALDVVIARLNDEGAPNDVSGACLSLLAALASGREVEDDDDNYRPPPQTDGPIQIAPVTEQVRKRLHGLLPVEILRKRCKGHAACLKHLAQVVGYTHELEDMEAIDAIDDALCYTEGGEVSVQKSGLMGLTHLCDRRRRLGKKGRVLMPSRPLFRCLESALKTSGSEELLSCAMAAIWVLFADTDRSEAEKVDIAELGQRILEPFLGSQDVGHQANGLSAMAALLACSTKDAARMLQLSQVPFTCIMHAIQQPPFSKEGKAAQSYAVECFFLATGDVATRQAVISSGGIDILINALGDGQEGSQGLMHAKIMAVLSILASHNKDIREEIFDRIDFMVQLRYALDSAREASEKARKAEKEGKKNKDGSSLLQESRRLLRALYESCACLTIHGEFKEVLFESKKTLKAIQDLPSAQDLIEDPQLSFFYASIVYNLCRSKEDRIRPKKESFPFSDMGEDDLNAIEEFYEKMPQQGRPAKNGEIDPGSKELAQKMRHWCVMDSSKKPGQTSVGGPSASSLVGHLGKCAAHGSVRVKQIAAFVMKFLCQEPEHRPHIVAAGGVRTLLNLVDLEDDHARDAARQALAQICIVTNPAMMQYSEQLDAVRPLQELMTHRHELLVFEAAMGLTNLLGSSDELRTRCIQGEGWTSCRDLLFSENEMVQRAGVEAMCNLCLAPEILERFAEGRCELEIKVFIAFSRSDDPAMVMASTGALAMLASCEPVAAKILEHEKLDVLFETLDEAKEPGVQHRIVSVFVNMADCEECPKPLKEKITKALKAKQKKGITSKEALGILARFSDA